MTSPPSTASPLHVTSAECSVPTLASTAATPTEVATCCDLRCGHGGAPSTAASGRVAAPPRMAGSGRYTGTQPLPCRRRWNPCCNCLWSSLPDTLVQSEVLPLLSHRELMALMGVSSRWNYIVESAPLWRNVHFSPAPATGVGLSRLLTRQRHVVQSLTAHKLRASSEEEVAALSALHLDRLTELDLSGSKHVPVAALMDVIVRHAATLKVLQLNGVGTITDDHVRTIVTTCTHLRYLSISGCRQVTDAGVAACASAGAFNRMVSVNINGCGQVTGAAVANALSASAELGTVRLRSLHCRGIAAISDALCSAIAASAPGITSLDIGSADPYATALRLRPAPADAAATTALSDRHVTDAGLALLAAHLTELQHLRLQGHALLTDHGMAAALRRWPQLETVDVRGCRLIGGDTVAVLASTCPHLTELCLFGCVLIDDDALTHLHRMKRLSVLDLYGCRAVTLPAVTALVEALAVRGCGTPTSRTRASTSDSASVDSTSTASTTPPPPPLVDTVEGMVGGSLRTVYLGGIPAIRAAMASVNPCALSTLAGGLSTAGALRPCGTAAAGATMEGGGDSSRSSVVMEGSTSQVANPLFPPTVEVKIC